MSMVRCSAAKKIEEAQFLIASGKSKTEAARALGFSNHVGLYKLMERNNMRWNPEKGNYEPVVIEGGAAVTDDSSAVIPTGKEGSVISMFKRGMDGRDIAKQLRFRDYQAMADFMKVKGYIWDESKNNYICQPRKVTQEPQIQQPPVRHQQEAVKPEVSTIPKDTFGEHLEALKWLTDNMERLMEVISDKGATDTIPRYILPGTVITKSIKITDTLDRLIYDFSQEKGVTQKEVVQAALIEFFKRHGYKHEVMRELKL